MEKETVRLNMLFPIFQPIQTQTGQRGKKIIGYFNRLLEQKQKIQYICAYLGDS